ncbi:MAG: caspase family protein [Saprospiraceae bacterium]|nr:caspase family protein [Saprospiraceae bacterium]
MFRVLRTSLILLSCCLISFSPIWGQQTNHAALIGVGAYPAASGWATLSSANDLELLSLTLQDVGFQSKNIHTIQDEQATKRGIISFLNKEVAPKLHKGDLLLLHFSGHGQQAADDNGDESDQLDECWVPFDSPKNYQAGVNEGENLLRDDEIGSILDNLLKRVGPEGQLFISVDACHSGTSTRGMGTARGTDVIMADPASVRTGLFGKHRSNPTPVPELVTSESRKNLIVLTSSSPTQLSQENIDSGQGFGVYTYQFCKCLRSIDPDATVNELFDEVKSRISGMGYDQRPTAEGDLETPLFGGRLKPPVPVYRIAKLRAPDTVQLAVGSLKGIYPGSLMNIYPSGITDTTGIVPIGRGVITKVTSVTSDLALTKAVTESALANCRAYQIYAAAPPIDLSIHLQDLSPASTAVITATLKNYPFIRISDLPARMIVEDTQDSIFLWTSYDRLLWKDKISESNGERMIKAIKQHVEAIAMRLIETKDPEYLATVRMEIIDSDDNWVPFAAEEVVEGDLMRLVVTNTGDTPYYYSLVDVQPDDQIITLIPPLGNDPKRYQLKPGKSWTSPAFNVKPPYGAETVKLICTDKPVHLGQIQSTRSIPSKPHLLELLYASSFPEISGTRGISIDEKPAGSGSVHTLQFSIVENRE